MEKEETKNKQWYEKKWTEYNRVQLIRAIERMSENRDWSSWEPDPEDIELYKKMYEKAKNNWPDDYTLLGCVLPEKFGKKMS